MNETNITQNISEVMNVTSKDVVPAIDAHEGIGIISDIYKGLLDWIILALTAFINFIFNFTGVTLHLSPEQMGLLFSVVGIVLAIFKWRGVYSGIKTYFFAFIVVILILIIASAFNVI